MIERSASWRAIFKPGQAEDFFEPAPPEAFDPDAAGFSPVNAWWLSEMARLVYRRDPGHDGLPNPTRGRILARVGLAERATFSDGNLFAALIESAGAAQRPFAALVFRGSSGHLDNWMANLDAKARPWPTGGKVHGGFKKALLGFWPQILAALRDIDRPIFYTGHSLGAALATLAASLRPPRALYTFGSPRVGDSRFVRTLASLPVFRIANPRDIVTGLPPAGFPFRYRHAGQFQPFGPGIRWNPGPEGCARRFLEPPVFLADHAPVGYTDGLIDHFSPSP
jgi:triacylglycerol lipase